MTSAEVNEFPWAGNAKRAPKISEEFPKLSRDILKRYIDTFEYDLRFLNYPKWSEDIFISYLALYN